jgi:DNA-binding transcriptional LysR family regulator
MDLRQLRTFVTVTETGTVSEAAARLGIAQPALSRQIQNLERDLGVRLFDRIRRRLVLTSEGELLLTECRGVLKSVGFLTDRAQLLRRPDAGVLKVVATPQTIDGVLAKFLARYSRSRPDVQVKLTESFGAEMLRIVERGEAHMAVTTAGAIATSDYPFEVTWLPSLEFVAACSPAADLPDVAHMGVRRLGTHPLLLMTAGFLVRGAFDAACRIAQFNPNVAFESRTPHTLLALAEAGHGAAIVPSVLPTHRYDLRIIRLDYRNRPLREGYGIATDRRRTLPLAASDFSRSLVSYVREVFPISRPGRPARANGAKQVAAKRVAAKRGGATGRPARPAR